MRINGFVNADELRSCRALIGWTQLRLARQSGFSVRTVKYHEAKLGRIDGVAPGRFRDLFESAGLRLSPLPERRIEPNPGLWLRVQLADQVLPSGTPSTKPKQPLKKQCGAKTRKGNPALPNPFLAPTAARTMAAFRLARRPPRGEPGLPRPNGHVTRRRHSPF